MENRWSQRTPVQFDLIIYYGPLGLIRAKSMDMSKNGMFIETGRITLSPDEKIELTFNYPPITADQTYQMTANVIHSGELGSGIEFVDYSMDELFYNPGSVHKRAVSF